MNGLQGALFKDRHSAPPKLPGHSLDGQKQMLASINFPWLLVVAKEVTGHYSVVVARKQNLSTYENGNVRRISASTLIQKKCLAS